MHRVVFLALFASSAAFAQEEQKVVYKHVTEIDMPGLEVDATVQGPGGTLVAERPPARFSPTLPIRHDFNEEMAESGDQIR